MEEKIRKYVDMLFQDAPRTKKAIELRQELYSNLMEKYNDLIASGATPEEAYEVVKGSVGNVNELFGSLYENKTEMDTAEEQMKRKKSAVFRAIAVSLYILSPIFPVILVPAGFQVLGVVLLFVCIAAATGLLVYSNAVFAPYKKADDTIVEEFKEWSSDKKGKKEKKYRYSGVFWLFIVILYFVISFAFAPWSWVFSWLIFLIGAAIDQLIRINLNK